jgi:hypothetical protein
VSSLGWKLDFSDARGFSCLSGMDLHPLRPGESLTAAARSVDDTAAFSPSARSAEQ